MWGGHAPGDGAKSPGYVASPGKMLRHEPCCGESHAASLREQTSPAPLTVQQAPTLRIASSFFRLRLPSTVSIFITLLASRAPVHLPSSLPPASRNFDLSPQILQRHPCPHGLFFSSLHPVFQAVRMDFPRNMGLSHTTPHPENSRGTCFVKKKTNTPAGHSVSPIILPGSSSYYGCKTNHPKT